MHIDELTEAQQTASLLEAQRTTIAELRRLTTWQPLATAPKDGTCILLTSDDPTWKYPFPAFWDVAQGCWIFADWPLNDIWGVSDLVSHWMPLPTPPTDGGEK